MHVAAEVSGAVALVKLLAERGADVNAVTPDRWTPLHVAAAAGNAEAIRALLQNGADPTRRTLDGRTAEGIARGLRKRGIAEMLRDAASRSEGNPSRER
jgi:ankyrin repeat protein